MKVFLAIVVGGLLLIGIIVGAVLWGTSGLADTGHSFVEALAAQRFDAVRALGTPAFRENANDQQLAEYRVALRLSSPDQVTWQGREFSGDSGSVYGVLTPRGGEARPITLGLRHIDGDWRVQSVVTWPVGLVAAPGPSLPDERLLVEMSRQALRTLFQAAASDDFRPMHARISHLWREQITPEGLAESFGALTASDTKLIDNATIVFDGPARLESNDLILVVEGTARAEEPLYKFTLKWIQEGLGWRLFGINVRDP